MLSLGKASAAVSVAARKHQRDVRVQSVYAGAEQAKCVIAAHSQHNPNIMVCELDYGAPDMPAEMHGARVLVTDSSGACASVYHKDHELTGAYYDYLSLLPAIPGLPEGPISVLGLGAGTISRILAKHFPDRQQHGWELDEAVLTVSRLFLGLRQIEDSGKLIVHAGDALKPGATVTGGSAGIIVDMFSQGKLLPELTRIETWLNIKQRLAPGGRVMAYLGEPSHSATEALHMMALAFHCELQVFTFADGGYANTIVLTGPVPDTMEWQAGLSAPLKEVFVNTSWLSLH